MNDWWTKTVVSDLTCLCQKHTHPHCILPSVCMASGRWAVRSNALRVGVLLRHGDRVPLFLPNTPSPGAVGPPVAPSARFDDLEQAFANDLQFWQDRTAERCDLFTEAKSPVSCNENTNIDRMGRSPVSMLAGQLTDAGARQLRARGEYFATTVLSGWLTKTSSDAKRPINVDVQSSNYTRTQRSAQEFLAGLHASAADTGAMPATTPIRVSAPDTCPLAVFESRLPLAHRSRHVLKRFSERTTDSDVQAARTALIAAIPYFQPDAEHTDATSLHPDTPAPDKYAGLLGLGIPDLVEPEADTIVATPGTSEADAAVTGHRGPSAVADETAKGSLAAFKRRFLWIRAADALHAAKSHGYFAHLPSSVQEAARVTSSHCLDRFAHMYDDPTCRRFATAAPLHRLLRGVAWPEALRAQCNRDAPSLTVLSAHDVTLMPVFRALLPHAQRDHASIGWPDYSAAVVLSLGPWAEHTHPEGVETFTQTPSQAEAAASLGHKWLENAQRILSGCPGDVAETNATAVRIACGMLGVTSDLESIESGRDLVAAVLSGSELPEAAHLLAAAAAALRGVDATRTLALEAGLEARTVLDAPTAAVLRLPVSPMPSGEAAGRAVASVSMSLPSLRLLSGAAASGCQTTWLEAQQAVWGMSERARV